MEQIRLQGIQRAVKPREGPRIPLPPFANDRDGNLMFAEHRFIRPATVEAHDVYVKFLARQSSGQQRTLLLCAGSVQSWNEQDDANHKNGTVSEGGR